MPFKVALIVGGNFILISLVPSKVAAVPEFNSVASVTLIFRGVDNLVEFSALPVQFEDVTAVVALTALSVFLEDVFINV
ncbi:MAG: hypothetical protein IJS29_10615 [Selenomonadaceae bacterium]|nr:hypothetical protein [Selenomonadaceae bacterium]